MSDDVTKPLTRDEAMALFAEGKKDRECIEETFKRMNREPDELAALRAENARLRAVADAARAVSAAWTRTDVIYNGSSGYLALEAMEAALAALDEGGEG